jgi:hypothetical protein
MVPLVILDLVKGALSIGKDALDRRARRKEVKLEAENRVTIARAEAEIVRLEKMQSAEIEWDNEVARQMERTWKDEYFTLLLSVPLVLSFIGEWGRTRVAEGFQALQNVPDWYMYALLTAIAASFGMRALANKFGLRR